MTAKWTPQDIKGRAALTAPAAKNPVAGKRGRARSTPDDKAVDAHIGARVKLRRINLGWSQVKLGEELGKTFQQVQKYERGANGMRGSVLWRAADVLDVPVSFFFDGLDRSGAIITPADDVTRKDLQIARALACVKSDKVKGGLLELVRSLGD